MKGSASTYFIFAQGVDKAANAVFNSVTRHPGEKGTKMINKGYDPDTLRAMTHAASNARPDSFVFLVDNVWWLVTGWIDASPRRPTVMRLADVWLNGQWLEATDVLSRPLIEALTELLQTTLGPETRGGSNAQA